MNLIKIGIATAVLALGCWGAGEAKAYDFYLTCEQGAPSSWKMCEAVTDYPGPKTFQWYGNTGTLLADNCRTGRRFCSTYCGAGSTANTAIFLNVLNSSGQLVGTASKTIGCIH